jgi:hypothetical protein
MSDYTYRRLEDLVVYQERAQSSGFRKDRPSTTPTLRPATQNSPPLTS